MSVSELEFLLDDFMGYCQMKNLSPKTLASYEQSLKLLVVYLGNEAGVDNPSHIRSLHIRNYVTYLQTRGKYTVVSRTDSVKDNFPDHRTDYRKQISNVTINNYLRNMKVFFKWLVGEGEIRKNPMQTIPFIKTERRMKSDISREEFLRLINQFDDTTFHGYRNKVLTLLLQDTGLRIGESLKINVEDIDFKHRMILAKHTKGRKERYVYFSNVLQRDLKRYIVFKDRYTESDLLFPTKRNTEMTIHSFEKQLKDVGKRANIQVHPHQLRNNFARHYLLNGGDIYTLSRILGHSSVQVTEQAYLDLTKEEIAKSYQNFSPLAKWR